MTLGEAVSYYEANPPRGEFVLIVEGAKEEEKKELTIEDAVQLVARQIESGVSKKDAVKAVSKETGLAKNTLYDAVLKQLG